MTQGAHYRSRYKLELTPRQREVLDLIVKGQTNAEIAIRLDLSLDGVKWHVREILGKLGVDSREEAAALWRGYNRPVARLARGLSGLFGIGTLKTAIAGAGLVAAGGAATAVFFALQAGGGAKADPAASEALDGPPCTSAEVSINPNVVKTGSIVRIMPGLNASGECVLSGDLVFEISGTKSAPPQIDGNPLSTRFEPVVFHEVPVGARSVVSLPAEYSATWSNWCDEPPVTEVRIAIGGIEARAPVTVTPDCMDASQPSRLQLGKAPAAADGPSPTLPAGPAQGGVVLDDRLRDFAEQFAALVTKRDFAGVMETASPITFTCPDGAQPPAWPYPVCDGLAAGAQVDGYVLQLDGGSPQYVPPQMFEEALAARLPALELATVGCKLGDKECTIDMPFVIAFKTASGGALSFVFEPSSESRVYGPSLWGLGEGDDPAYVNGGPGEGWPGSIFYIPLIPPASTATPSTLPAPSVPDGPVAFRVCSAVTGFRKLTPAEMEPVFTNERFGDGTKPNPFAWSMYLSDYYWVQEPHAVSANIENAALGQGTETEKGAKKLPGTADCGTPGSRQTEAFQALWLYDHTVRSMSSANGVLTVEVVRQPGSYEAVEFPTPALPRTLPVDKNTMTRPFGSLRIVDANGQLLSERGPGGTWDYGDSGALRSGTLAYLAYREPSHISLQAPAELDILCTSLQPQDATRVTFTRADGTSKSVAAAACGDPWELAATVSLDTGEWTAEVENPAMFAVLPSGGPRP